MSVPDRRQRLPPAAMAAKINESSPYDSAKTYVSRSNVWLWTCDDCGDSGMTILVQQCPQCQHYRCKNCAIEKGNKLREPFFPITCQYDVLKKDSVPNVLPPQSSLKASLPPGGPASATSKLDGQGFESPAADEGITPLPSAETPDLIMASDIGLSSGYSTPSSEVILTPTSTQESDISSGPFSHQDYMDSETEFETDDTESVEDITDDEDTMKASDYAVDIFDSRLFSILGHDLELASRLIQQIHAQLQLGFGTETGVYTASPSHDSKGVPETYGDFSASGFTPGNGSSHNGSPQNKRGRERDESKDRGDKSGSKRQRRFQDPSAMPRRLYACHFHKKDPTRYCPLTDRKFNMCLGRGNIELRRMKGHYQKAHRPSQCERCYTIFKDHNELKNHRQAESPCHNQPDRLKEGIDDSQWAKMEPLFRVRRNLSPLQKELDDINNWFEIWDILFPNVSRPPNPWVNFIPISSNALPLDAEGLLTIFNNIIELDVERGDLQRDDEGHQRYERAFRLALQTHTAVSAPAASFDHPFPEVNEPRNDSAEHSTGRQTTAEVLENSLGQLFFSQPTPQHLPIPYQDRISLRLETQSVLSSSRQFDVPEGTYTSQPSNESLSSNVPNTSTLFESPTDLRGTSTTQQHLAVSSSTYCQSEAMSVGQKVIEYPVASNTEKSQHLELLSDSEFAESSYFDGWQDDFMPFDNNSIEFDEEQLNSDSLSKILELENEDPAALAVWENSHDKT